MAFLYIYPHTQLREWLVWLASRHSLDESVFRESMHYLDLPQAARCLPAPRLIDKAVKVAQGPVQLPGAASRQLWAKFMGFLY